MEFKEQQKKSPQSADVDRCYDSWSPAFTYSFTAIHKKRQPNGMSAIHFIFVFTVFWCNQRMCDRNALDRSSISMKHACEWTSSVNCEFFFVSEPIKCTNASNSALNGDLLGTGLNFGKKNKQSCTPQTGGPKPFPPAVLVFSPIPHMQT